MPSGYLFRRPAPAFLWSCTRPPEKPLLARVVRLSLPSHRVQTMANSTPTQVSRQTKPAPLATPSPSVSITNAPNTNCESPSSDDPTTTMPPRNPQRPSGRGPPRREIDLSGLLTPAHKTELVQLISTLTDSMQQQIAGIFEQPPASSSPDDGETFKAKAWSFSAGSSNVKSPTLPFQDATKPTNDPAVGRLLWEPAADGRPAVMGVSKCENEDYKKGQLELAKDVMAAFKKWQTAVIKRIGDISAGREHPSPSTRQAPVRFPPKPLPGKHPHRSPAASSKFPVANGSKAQKEGRSHHTCRVHRSLVYRPPKLIRAGIATSVVEADAAFQEAYRPAETSLSCLPFEKRTLLLHSMCLLLLSLESYNAYTRVLLLHLASSLHVPLHTLTNDEERLARALSQAMVDLSTDDSAPKKGEENKGPRRGRTGQAGPLGPNAGLAAALGAAGIGTVAGGASLGRGAAAGLMGGMSDNAFVHGTLFGLHGGRGAGKMMESYTRDIADIALIPLHGNVATPFREARVVPTEDRRLRVAIAVSGWVGRGDDILTPWKFLGRQSEAYVWQWEGEALVRMGDALETVLKTAAWSTARREIGPANSLPGAARGAAAAPVFASLLGGIWPASLLRISKIIDGPWSVGMVRADKAGHVLADAILNKIQGERSVTLVGYGLGARVIYTCLMSLAERRVFGVVENVVLMGVPAPSDERSWSALRSVVAGRLINVFSANDYLMGFLYRTSSINFGVAGLQRIEGVEGVQNVDATDLITVHLRYRHLAGRILKNIGWEDVILGQVSLDEETLRQTEAKLAEDERKRECLPEPETAATQVPESTKKKRKQRKNLDARKETAKLAK